MLVAMGGYMLVVEQLVALISMAFVLPQIVLMPLLQGRINRLIERRVVLLRRFGDKLANLPGTDDAFRPSDMQGVPDRVFDNLLRIHICTFGQTAIMNLRHAITP